MEGGVSLLYDANTPKIIENIIYSEFNLKINIKIEKDENASNKAYELQAIELEHINEEIKKRVSHTQIARHLIMKVIITEPLTLSRLRHSFRELFLYIASATIPILKMDYIIPVI